MFINLFSRKEFGVYKYMLYVCLSLFTSFVYVGTAHASTVKSFYYPFNWTGTLEQKNTMQESSSPFYWLSSGGRMIIKNGIGRTMSGDAPIGSDWQEAYAHEKSESSDGGLHPQNIFRVLTKDQWYNADQQFSVRVDSLHQSDSSQRKASNGIFLVHRYQIETGNAYYTGLRVDGNAVIKKKIHGRYYTLDLKPVFNIRGAQYERETAPLLLPLGDWIGIKSSVVTQSNGDVKITVLFDPDNTGNWQVVAEAIDNGVSFGDRLDQSGHVGFWTDFMDASFDDYRMYENVPERVLADTFSSNGTIEEVGSMAASSDSIFWLNSGAYFYRANGVGRTVFGALPIGSVWQRDYTAYNPESTDNGVHPQNIFRLVTKSTWQNQQQEVHFRIQDMNYSDGEKRNQSNGVLLFNRYVDSDNLYYVGIRVDGKAVIKKKINGQYFTIAYTTVYPGTYNRVTQPNLIPEHEWIGLRSVVQNISGGRVKIDMYMDLTNNGQWQLITSAIDDGQTYGGRAFTESAHSGIRTDFMDVAFDNYRIEEK